MHSAAFNSLDHLSGSPDPKTGTYSFTETIGPVKADGQSGPKCNLILSYSLLSTLGDKNLTGLGKGWSFKLGSYSRSANMLTLNTGASYKVLHASPTKPWTLSHKLKDIRVEEKDTEVHIYHKNGDLEVMEIDSQTQDAVLTRFTSANGRYLIFKYEEFLGYKRLIAVHDRDHTLATVTYDDNKYETIIVTYPNTPDARTTKLYMTPDGFLSKIERPDDEHISFEYKRFTYDDSSLSLSPIKCVKYSNGASEEMEYEEKLHLPATMLHPPIPFTPGLTKYTKLTATDQPHIITTFVYRDDGEPAKDYWGYKSGVSWQSNTDCLFNYPSQYHYSSTTKCGDQVTKSVYNKFHQDISTIQTNGEDSRKIITTKQYYSDEDSVLKDQPTMYELPKKVTTKYQQSASEVSREFSKSYEYDDWGNVLVENDVNGIRTVSEYYPPEGGDGCPAHPHGMVAYVKRRSHISSDGLLKKSYSYTYQSIPRIGGGIMIVPAAECYGNVKKTFTYYDGSDPKIQGLLKSKAVTINGKGTTTSNTYGFPDNNTICIKETVTGHDGLSTSTSTTLSIWNGLKKQETDEAGVVTAYTHDTLGRMLSVTTGVGTDYKVKTNYQYIQNPTDPSSGKRCIGLNVVQETTSGTTVHTYYDGEERELVAYQKDKYGILRKLLEKNYDDQGRKVSHTEFDYVISEADHSIEKTMSEKVTYAYDTWGSHCETGHSDGTVELVVRDPINDTLTHQTVRKDSAGKVIDALSLTKATLNSFGSPTKTEVFDQSGKLYSTTLVDYDQFGRKTKVTRPTGATAGVTKYDDLDRPVEFQHYDGTVFVVSYASMDTESRVSAISVPSLSVTLGEQEYDGLFRITSRTVNGVKTQFSYEDGYKQPSRRVNGRGQTLLFDYIPELDMQPSRVASFANNVQARDWDNASKISESVYTYGKTGDPSSAFGQILSASSPAGHYKYEYSLGVLVSTTQVVGSQSQTITKEKSTMGGKPLYDKIGDDRKVTYNRNEQGNVTSIIDGNVMIEVSLDGFSRISKKMVKQYNPSSKSYEDLLQTTATSYDEYSRETTRTIDVEKSGKVISIQSSYDNENKVVGRTVSVNNTDSLTESYRYDSKRRLIAYEAVQHTTDTLLPQNENGKPFTSQTFAFDGLDNITSIVTKFPNGSSDTATLVYDQSNKQRLIRISHTLTRGANAYPAVMTLHYDADGNITSYKDSFMAYTVSGRLAKMNDTVYSYDPFDRLVKSNDTLRVYSDHSHVIRETGSNGTTDFLRYGGIPIGEIRNGRKKIYGVDQSFSTVSVTDDTSMTAAVIYSPYGNSDNGARIGLNGELRDITDSNVYHLGNGTRTYWPAFNGFSTADSCSPFLGGGINPYKYCCGDPVNAVDPSGHMSVLKGLEFLASFSVAVLALIAVPFTAGSSLGLYSGVIGGICGVLSTSFNYEAEIYKDKGAKNTSKELSVIGSVLGIASAVFSFGQIFFDVRAVVKAARLARSAPEDLTDLRENLQYGNPKHNSQLDNLVTTGYKIRYTVARDSGIVSELFYVGNIDLTASDLHLTDKVEWAKNICDLFYVRKVLVPIRVLKNGQYAGMCHILSKSSSFLRAFGSATQFRKGFSSADTLFSRDSNKTHSSNQSGSEPSVTHCVYSAFDVPTYHPVKAEKLLFNF